MNKQILSLVFVLASVQFCHAQYDSIKHDGYDRTYLVHLPANYSSSSPTPLVLAMHHGFGSASGFETYSKLSIKSDEEGFIVVYPEGIKDPNFGYRSWNGGGCCGYARDQDIDDVGFLNALLDTLEDQYSIDPNRIYAAGFSNGGFLTFRLGCELSHRIAAIATVGASMNLPSCTPGYLTPVINIHSVLDDVVPYLGGYGTSADNFYSPPQDSIMDVWTQLNNCANVDTVVQNTEYTFVKSSACDCNNEVHYYLTQDGGHTWPNDNNYINATDLIWDFLSLYSFGCNATGNEVLKESKKNLTVYPNPSSGQYIIELSEQALQFKVTVFDSFGRNILQQENTLTLDLTDYKSSLFYLLIETGDNMHVKKLLKR